MEQKDYSRLMLESIENDNLKTIWFPSDASRIAAKPRLVFLGISSGFFLQDTYAESELICKHLPHCVHRRTQVFLKQRSGLRSLGLSFGILCLEIVLVRTCIWAGFLQQWAGESLRQGLLRQQCSEV